MTLRARIGQGALTFAHLAGLRPAARTPAPAAEREDGLTAEEISQHAVNDAATHVATLSPAPVADAEPPQPRAEGGDPEPKPEDGPTEVEELRARVEELERRMPAEDCEAETKAAAVSAAWIARLNAVFASPEAQGQSNLAVMLTFGTDKDAETIIADLRAAAKATNGLDARMAGAPAAAIPPAQPALNAREQSGAAWGDSFARARQRR